MNVNIETGIDTNYSLLQSKVDSLKNPVKVNRKYSDAEKKELAETARGFESIFVNMMYKGMKDALLNSFENEKDSEMSFGADTLGGITDMAFADQISNTGNGIGLAQMLYKQITGDNLNQNTKPISFSQKGMLGNIFEKNNKNLEIKFDISSNNNEIAVNGNLLERVNNRINKYEPIISQASKEYDIPIPLIKAVITAESAGNINAKSAVGAKGLMQLMDGTAKGLGVRNSFDPKQNILGGTKYLRQMLDTFDGNLEYAIAAYNAGPGNVKKYGGIPPFKETQGYVKKVKQHFSSFNKIENGAITQ
jgi:Rod binding domain-containing protein